MKKVKIKLRNINGWVSEQAFDDIRNWLEGKCQGELIKDNLARSIWKLSTSENTYYIKKFKSHKIIQSIKTLLLGSKAMQEYQALKRLQSLRINTIEPLGVLSERRGLFNSSSYLITRAKTDFISLLDVISSTSSSRVSINTLLQGLAYFLANLHNSGFLSYDTHSGNILVKTNAQNPEFCLIDVHRASFLPHPLTQPQRQNSLAFLIHSIYPYYSTRDIVRFLKYYVKFYPQIQNFHLFLKQIFKKYLAIKKRHNVSRTKRCLATNTNFEVIKDGAQRIYRRKEMPLDEIKETIKSSENTTPIKVTHNRSIILHNNKFIKRYLYNTLAKKIEIFFKGSPGFRAWLNSNGLLVRGVSTPKCFALIESTEYSTIICEWLETALPLFEFIKRELRSKTLLERKDFLRNFADFLRKLHMEGIYHADLKANNILVRNEQDIPRFYLLDLDRVCFTGKLNPSRILKNLAQLNASIGSPITRTDRLRFYNLYTRGNSYFLNNKKPLIQKIMKLTRKRRHIWP